MAGLRSNRALNRTNRGIIDHDIMEGLPVRQWRKQPVTVNPAPPREAPQATNDPNDRWKELPMPRGSELYTPMSQALLRAARRGHITKPHGENADSEREGTEEEEVEVEPETVISTVKWSQIAKEQEVPEIEYLAKRRKGLPSLVDEAAAGTSSVPMRKVKVRKLDAAGNAAVYEVLAPVGVQIEGEIVEGEEIMTEAPAPGTVVAGVGIANADGVVIAGDQAMPAPRRMPPRPKRKMKGPGRGRKKKQMLAPGAEGGTGENGAGAAAEGGEGLKVPGTGGDLASGSDVDMGNESTTRDGDEGSEEDDDEGDEGEEGELSDAGHSRSVSKEPSAPARSEKTIAPAAPEQGSAPQAGIDRHFEPAPTSALFPIDASTAVASETAPVAGPPIEPPIIAPPVLVSPTFPAPMATFPLGLPETQPPPISSADTSAPAPVDHPMPDSAPTEREAAAPTVSESDIAMEAVPAPVIHAVPAEAIDIADPTHPSVSEEAAPALVGAEIPPEHNPLEGLAEPRPNEASEGALDADPPAADSQASGNVGSKGDSRDILAPVADEGDATATQEEESGRSAVGEAAIAEFAAAAHENVLVEDDKESSQDARVEGGNGETLPGLSATGVLRD